MTQTFTTPEEFSAYYATHKTELDETSTQKLNQKFIIPKYKLKKNREDNTISLVSLEKQPKKPKVEEVPESVSRDDYLYRSILSIGAKLQELLEIVDHIVTKATVVSSEEI